MVPRIHLACAVLTLSVTVSSTYLPYGLLEQTSKRSTQKYCGNEINEALKMICHSVYNTMFARKRNGDFSGFITSSHIERPDFIDHQYRLPNTMGEEDSFVPLARRKELTIKPEDLDSLVAAVQHLRYPFASKATSLTMLPQTDNFIRRKRGVHDECCKKSCSLNELASYCGSN
ncbi:Insulin/IGF/Relaxin family [Nesidiocoris tenuis]|uniref:Insulin/IGF/Relaxin family n=1 Tax=Nesidiocoris tenuis TaxID=355587 RepID=A0ABN7AF20_9HEMI|nr:Insulin/IGF/Relaxin family [Nesidiocoris tenuis]